MSINMEMYGDVNYLGVERKMRKPCEICDNTDCHTWILYPDFKVLVCLECFLSLSCQYMEWDYKDVNDYLLWFLGELNYYTNKLIEEEEFKC